jgi:hypothetical protein
MDSAKSLEQRSEPMPISSATSSSDRVQFVTTSNSVSPPMSPSAFSPTSPIAESPEVSSSKSFSVPHPFQARSITRSITTDGIFPSRSKSSRKSPPSTIDIKPAGSSTTPPTNPGRTSSEPAVSPISPGYPTSPSRPSALKRTRKTSGTTSHYGRHGNDWLFGGISVRETVKGIWKDNDGQDR